MELNNIMKDESDLNLKELEGKTILISGATGLIGKTLVFKLMKYNETLNNPVRIVALIRNREKADKIFGENLRNVVYCVGDIINIDLGKLQVNYIVHAASQTSSKGFIDYPVETTLTSLMGTQNLLEFAAKQRKLERFVFLSTMEVYGTPNTDDKIFENTISNLDNMNVRSCYPESKRMCENLCRSYMSEYDVKMNILRLTQTFGPGVEYDDGRVFAEFARCVIEGKDIILKTKGQTKRSYLYTDDAVNAILTVMLSETYGEVFNVSNEETYCSIYEMAEFVAHDIAQDSIKVLIEEQDITKTGYAQTLKMNLDTTKLKKLGWYPKMSMKQMFTNMIKDMEKN